MDSANYGWTLSENMQKIMSAWLKMIYHILLELLWAGIDMLCFKNVAIKFLACLFTHVFNYYFRIDLLLTSAMCYALVSDSLSQIWWP